jgi:hypothetical protein
MGVFFWLHEELPPARCAGGMAMTGRAGGKNTAWPESPTVKYPTEKHKNAPQST